MNDIKTHNINISTTASQQGRHLTSLDIHVQSAHQRSESLLRCDREG